jgi:hypothetical protein
MDDLVMLSRNLFEFYGALVLGCGIVLGVIAGRVVRRMVAEPTTTPPELDRQRLLLLEHEVDAMQAEVERLRQERDFLDELRRPPRLTAA